MSTVNFRSLVFTGTSIARSSDTDLRQFARLLNGPYEGFASGAFQEVTPAGPFPTNVVWWTSSAKTTKISEIVITWNTNSTINTTVTTMYDTDGLTVLAVVTDTYTYSGIFLVSTTRTVA
jgi:hypothetical protein